jgi:hypothetical protein
VWGAEQPQCCTSNLANFGCFATATEPVHNYPQNVGIFAAPDACNGLADLTRDGIVDLGGNAREIVLDAAVWYRNSDCLKPGIQHDPLCPPKDKEKLSARGGSFRSTFDRAKLSLRTIAVSADDLGFRCVYRGTP